MGYSKLSVVSNWLEVQLNGKCHIKDKKTTRKLQMKTLSISILELVFVTNVPIQYTMLISSVSESILKKIIWLNVKIRNATNLKESPLTSKIMIISVVAGSSGFLINSHIIIVIWFSTSCKDKSS